MKRERIYELIDMERSKQDKKWGENRDQHPMVWLTILIEEIGEVAEAILKNEWKNVVSELIQCAAVVIAWLEMMSENDGMLEVYEKESE